MKTVRLSDVCKLVNGGTPKSGVPDYWGGDVAWLTPAEMGKRSTPYVAKTARTISRTGLANCSARQVPVGAVIMSTRAPIGHLVIPEVAMAFNQGCRGLLPDERLDTKYLYYFLWFSRDALNELGTGATFKELSSSALGSYFIPLPPLEEQRRIVALLDQAFAAIATATANAEKNLTNARELFGAIFGQMLFEPGPGWSIVEIRSIADLISGQHIDASDYNNQQRGIGYLTGPSDFGERNPIVTKWTEHPKRTALRGDILITVKGSGVGSVNVMDEGELAISRQLMAVRVNATDPELVYYALEAGFKHFQALATGAAIPGISRTDVLAFKIALPPKSELRSFMDRLHHIRASSQMLAERYRQQISCLAVLKQSLLHRAFTGTLTATMPETIAA